MGWVVLWLVWGLVLVCAVYYLGSAGGGVGVEVE